MSTTTIVNNLAKAQLSDTASSTTKADEAGTADRFLKLLVAQMQNQDPLNPMDNAQVTSQMAQINTVSGVEKLNATVQNMSTSMSGQFVQMQALQGAALVGRDVVVTGNQLNIDDGIARGGFELSSAADSVTVKIMDAEGKLLDTVDLKAQSGGMHGFEWPADKYTDASKLTFSVSAKTGTITSTPTALMQTPVKAVSTTSSGLQIQLGSGKTVSYGDIKAFN